MLNIKYIRENTDAVKKLVKERNSTVDVDELLKLDEERRELQQKLDEIRQSRNELASKLKKQKPTTEQIAIGKEYKKQLEELEAKHRVCMQKYQAVMMAIPNQYLPEVPLGNEEDYVVVKEVGNNKRHTAKDHLDFALKRDWVDFERGAKVAGSKFYFLKNELALLERALIEYGLDLVLKNNFTYMIVPQVVNQRVMSGVGYAPRTDEKSDEYFLEGYDMGLIASAEAPLTAYHADETLTEDQLPLKYSGLSTCYRSESGAAGKHNRGLFRVHQFNKLEMYAYTLPEKSNEMFDELIKLEEQIMQDLEIDYRIIAVPAGDMAVQSAKTYDFEYWSPVDGMYREITSASNCTDFQAKRLNMKVKRKDGTVDHLHTLNATAVTLARLLVVMIEQHQADDGRLYIPKVLRKYFGNKEYL